MNVVKTLKGNVETKDYRRIEMSLIPKIDDLINMQANVLLLGKHGVGKTQALIEAAEKHGKRVKYYSCATLDPFTDLVGIPYPKNDGEHLDMIRPKDIDEANIVFFDEMNRAQDSKTLNAILEIVQFGSINGEKLPNLEACWAAVNPVDEDETYKVQELDPALVDRFDVFFEIKPKVSVAYLEKRMDRGIAQALHDWWVEGQKGKDVTYISPRRIEKIGVAVDRLQDASIAKMMLPLDGNYDHQKLVYKLNVALGKVSMDSAKKFGDADPQLIYNKKWLRENSSVAVSALKSPDCSEETKNKIANELKIGIGAQRLLEHYGDILEALPSSKVEGLWNEWNDQKKSAFKRYVSSSKKNNIPNLKQFAATHEVGINYV